MLSTEATSSFIFVCAGIAILWAFIQFTLIANTKYNQDEALPIEKILKQQPTHTVELKEIYEAIDIGAMSFLRAAYSVCAIFVVFFSILIFSAIAWSQNMSQGFLTTLCFILGAVTSILSCYIGMKVAVFSNVRTTINAKKDGYEHCFNTAFRAGAVMGFALTGLGILVLYGTLLVYAIGFTESSWEVMSSCISGYGLGGSCIAMFGRVGGGIYSKAADVGADLVGKVVHGIPEDDLRNPTTIADNGESIFISAPASPCLTSPPAVGDNVGVVGMGADLFGSFAESTCAVLVIAAQSEDIRRAGWGAVCFPIGFSAIGILVCLIASYLAALISPVKSENMITRALRFQLIVSTFLMIPTTYFLATYMLPDQFVVKGVDTLHATSLNAFICVASGCIGGLIIALTTEYHTSKEYQPVKVLANSCRTGAATNIIYGLALGYKSVIVPVFVLAVIFLISLALCDLYGIALAAVGMLGNLATALTIHTYGPVCDNAASIAEIAMLPKAVREKTDALDSAGHTTAAVGTGFAIGSAALVSIANYGAFVVRIQSAQRNAGLESNFSIQILHPLTISFLFIGSMLPYWVSALTMQSVGEASIQMVHEVQRQYMECPELLAEGTALRPDYDKCVTVSTHAALREMIAPAALVILAPLLAGTLFGVHAVYGLLIGGLLTGFSLAISMSNTGRAWDNAKKYIEGGIDPSLGGKGSDCHKSAVVGYTVGDPLKDTSGPSLNVLMKLMATISLVFADYFFSINHGSGILGGLHSKIPFLLLPIPQNPEQKGFQIPIHIDISLPEDYLMSQDSGFHQFSTDISLTSRVLKRPQPIKLTAVGGEDHGVELQCDLDKKRTDGIVLDESDEVKTQEKSITTASMKEAWKILRSDFQEREEMLSVIEMIDNYLSMKEAWKTLRDGFQERGEMQSVVGLIDDYLSTVIFEKVKESSQQMVSSNQPSSSPKSRHI